MVLYLMSVFNLDKFSLNAKDLYLIQEEDFEGIKDIKKLKPYVNYSS